MQAEIADQVRRLLRARADGDRRWKGRRHGPICRKTSMKIDRIVLRQLRMPLVHFFETSFSRTYEREIVIVEVISDGLSGWGEITAGEHPFYNEEWTASAWLIARDYVAPRILRSRSRERGRSERPDTPHPRTQHGAGRRGGRRMGPAGPAQRESALERDRRRRPPRDSLRRLDRYPGLGRAAHRQD